jgi:hypothetical protein
LITSNTSGGEDTADADPEDDVIEFINQKREKNSSTLSFSPSANV